ncbi:hypothetical protein KKC97_08725 [bacterium]|nr:hypothetical protein [bacterium]MBU1637732.1 hypothetical protein [bacterium]MBU1920319.1 hypothetical protein [bacterium]
MIMTGSGYEAFISGAHAFECTWCHGGRNEKLLKDDAHVGLIADPSEGLDNKCAGCHADIAEHYATSLHATLNGEHYLFEKRTGFAFELHPTIEEEYNNECNKCHASCGSCHISRPKSVGGGFVQSHNFKRVPDLTNQCTACHGSRVGDEYTGKNEGFAADVHYVPAAMHCRNCHTGAEMHGDGTLYNYRYEVASAPACENCHELNTAENLWHATHGDNFACQVCHAQEYKNCNACHVGQGITGSSYLAFKVGKNPIPDLKSYEYAVLRHIPIAEDTYSPWEETTMPYYASEPSWKYATPHNIRRWTARTDTSGGQSCGYACHNTPDDVSGFFLRQADLNAMTSEVERQANQHLIVPDGPPTNW